MPAKREKVCHCGSGKMPGIMRIPHKYGDPVRWCCGECYPACVKAAAIVREREKEAENAR